MTKCALKNCKNHSSQLRKNSGITFHRFPQDAETREKWRQLVGSERGDESYKPTDRTVMCSAHFEESDFYYTHKGFRRLRLGALPNVEMENMEYGIPAQDKESWLDATIEGDDSDRPGSSADSPDISLLDPDLRESQIVPEVMVIEPELPNGFNSVLNTPEAAHIKTELKKCYERIIAKNKEIRNLRRRNKTLKKQTGSLKTENESLKAALKNLRKKSRKDSNEDD